MKVNRWFALVITINIGSVSAGQVEQATMKASAQMQVREGRLDGCGVRVLALNSPLNGRATAVDFSFNFYREGLSIVKAGVSEVNFQPGGRPPTSKNRPIQAFWLRADGGEATTPEGKGGFTKSEAPKGFIYYRTNSQTVSKLFGSFFSERPIQVGYKFINDDTDHIMSGTVNADAKDSDEVARCIEELTASMKRDIEASQ